MYNFEIMLLQCNQKVKLTTQVYSRGNLQVRVGA